LCAVNQLCRARLHSFPGRVKRTILFMPESNSQPVPNRVSREAGPTVGGVGAIVWKIVSVVSNVDFVVSFQSERFGAIMQTFQDWGWIVAAVGCALWAWQKFRTPEADGTQEKALITPGALIAGIGIAFLFGVMAAASSVASVPTVIQGWGPQMTPTGPACMMIMDTSRLKRFKDKFSIVGACGISDPTTDMYTDDEITISKPFTITGGAVTIEAKMNPQMAKVEMVPAITGQPSSPNGGQLSQPNQLNANTSVWYRAILVPKSVDLSRLKSLADIAHEGGRVVDPAMWK
jgi:hypothetical protein